MGKKIANPPKVFNVNWFRLDDDGKFMWPGFGDNMRVLNWILDRCDGKVDAVETPIGFVPKKEDINVEGLGISDETLTELLSVDKEIWKEEVKSQREFFAQFGDRLPKEIKDSMDELEAKLSY